jgi:hypothetical protein
MKGMSGVVAAAREIRIATAGPSGLRVETLRGTLNDAELDEDELEIAQLDPADRALILAARVKLLDMIQEELEVNLRPNPDCICAGTQLPLQSSAMECTHVRLCSVIAGLILFFGSKCNTDRVCGCEREGDVMMRSS